jgi:queuine tRNA-ribosyltransferase
LSTRFTVDSTDPVTEARAGALATRRGEIATPAFMPVGTQAAVKTVTPGEVRATGARIILANTYHLMLRPGPEVIERAGGLHRFMGWDGPILTDSGGYQVFSLANTRTVSETGVTFRSHIDGSRHELTPERAIDIQLALGSEIIMPLDVLTGFDASDDDQRAATDRTHRWVGRVTRYFSEATSGSDSRAPLLFGICQGGFGTERRARSAAAIAESNVSGSAIGGLSVGETKADMFQMLRASVAELPADRPRYLMGVGSPEDIWNAVSLGVDMFDCVHPTRVARRGSVFTRDGRVNLTAARYRTVFEAIEPDCDCTTCQEFSVAYLHHLFRAGELLAQRLATIHNLRFFGRMMAEIRRAIAAGTFVEQRRAFLERYVPVDEEVATRQRRAWSSREDSAVARGGRRSNVDNA